MVQRDLDFGVFLRWSAPWLIMRESKYPEGFHTKRMVEQRFTRTPMPWFRRYSGRTPRFSHPHQDKCRLTPSVSLCLAPERGSAEDAYSGLLKFGNYPCWIRAKATWRSQCLERETVSWDILKQYLLWHVMGKVLSWSCSSSGLDSLRKRHYCFSSLVLLSLFRHTRLLKANPCC